MNNPIPENQAVFEVIFAHNDEPLPAEFQPYPTPCSMPFSQLSDRQQRKWKSRRIAYFLLYQLVKKYQLDLNLLENIPKTASGRPYLNDDRVDFNISHSGDWVAIIFSFSPLGKKQVGIDIEHPQKVRRYVDLLHYYATPQEIAEIQNTHILPQLRTLSSRFYLSWCLREAILKSQGVGIVKLSEVQHSLSQQKLRSAYAPKGQLYFYFQLPFYLAYFVGQPLSMVSLPTLFQWKNGQSLAITSQPAILYQVN